MDVHRYVKRGEKIAELATGHGKPPWPASGLLHRQFFTPAARVQVLSCRSSPSCTGSRSNPTWSVVSTYILRMFMPTAC